MTIFKALQRIAVPFIALLAALVFAPASASAAALAPWWGITTGSRPTNLHTGVTGSSEVQELTVTATGGDVFIADKEAFLRSGLRSGFADVKFNATAAQMQEGLRQALPAHEVQVQEGEHDTAKVHTWKIVFPDQIVEPIFANAALAGAFGGGEQLACEEGGVECTPEVNVEELTTGTPVLQEIFVAAENLGDADALAPFGAPVSIVDKLPEGLHAVSAEALAGTPGGRDKRGIPTCALLSEREVQCKFEGETGGVADFLPPFEQIEVAIGVLVQETAKSGEQNTVSVSGGGATAERAATHEIEVGGAEKFGVEDFQLVPENPGGSVDTQAGSHPFQLSVVTSLNGSSPSFGGTLYEGGPRLSPHTVGLAKDLIGTAPAGLVGNPQPFAQCTDAQFATKPLEPVEPVINECPASTAIGVATVNYQGPGSVGFETNTVPIFNLKPRPGEPARFGFAVKGAFSVYLDTSVLSGKSYAVTLGSHNIPELQSLLSAKLTLWGVPGSSAHDQQRGWECLQKFGSCPVSTDLTPPPFLIMPTSCQEPFQAVLNGDTWSNGGKPAEQTEASFTLGQAIDGCNRLPFAPSIEVKPDVPDASTSTGLTVRVHLPQTSELNPEGLAESSLRDTTVTLPEGVAVNPSGGDGLAACTGSPSALPEGSLGSPGDQIGFTGIRALGELGPGVEAATFTPYLPESIGAKAAVTAKQLHESEATLQPGVNFCPDASKVGTVKIKLPILPNPLEGAVYIATQNANPFGSLIAMYLVAEDPVSGILVRVAGEVTLNPVTGQLVSTFKNSPQGPLEDLELHFFGGERAPLATPARCGSYTTSASFAPWSGNAAVSSTSTFPIEHGPGGGPCPGASLPFSPFLTGGTLNINAGSFTALTTTIGREDGQQNLQSVQLHMPEGVEGLLSGVKLCPEAQANAGTCGPESLIGETTVSAGVGSDPVSVKGGRVYLTEAYAGAPFGLSIVNPVKAGPFDLEHDTANPAQHPACDCLVVRAKIEVNPLTAELTVTTDPTGAHAIPHLIDGVPVQIRKVNVLVNRPNFTFNPTSCAPLSMTATITGDGGASSPVSVPFQATNCALLKFAPKLTVSTGAHGSKAKGASLLFKIAYPAGAVGTQSWLNEAKFDIPKQLPARLTTLQKACIAATFESNRSACPSASIIGHAIVHTPVLPVPLEGPVYFVSYGGAKFPDAVVVLHGYGITIESRGETFINNKTGVTSATFRSVPDVPFQTLEVSIPTGPFSEFGVNLPPKAKYSFCGQKLVMPTHFKASNGLEIHQNTSITVTGCPTKHKHKKHTKRASRTSHNKARAGHGKT